MISFDTCKNVLIAGGAGFIGTNLCRRLLEIGVSVWCVDNLHTGKLDNIQELLDCGSFHFINKDIRDFDDSCLPLGIDLVMNFACVASPKAYYASPIDTLLTSVLGVHKLLEYATGKGIPFLQASTSEVYGDPINKIISESYNGNVSCTGPRACYDEGKRAAETLCLDYHRNYCTQVRIVRIFNTYGPYLDTNDGRVIPEFISKALNNEDIIIYGSGKQTRSFMFIDDLIKGIFAILNSDETIATPINIGNPEEEHSIAYIAETIVEMTDSKSNIIYSDKRQDDPRWRKPDISKLFSKTGWRPTVTLEEGLLKTIDFFRDHVGKTNNYSSSPLNPKTWN